MVYCQLTPKTSINVPMNILMHITILFSFLTIAFIVYISKVEKSAFHSEIKNNIQKGLNNILNDPSVNKQEVLYILEKIPFEYLLNQYQYPTEYSTNNNKMLITQSIIIMVGLFLLLVSIVSISYLSCQKCVPVWSIIKENILTFIIIGMVELLFFYFVAMHYIPIKPSTITYTVIDILKKI